MGHARFNVRIYQIKSDKKILYTRFQQFNYMSDANLPLNAALFMKIRG